VKIRYRQINAKYQLAEDYSVETGIIPPNGVGVGNHFVTLSGTGRLTLRADYACDGPSGPTLDTKDFMRGAFGHDGGYQLIRLGYLPPEYRILFDKELDRVNQEDGMGWFRRQYVYAGVRLGGGASIEPRDDDKILEAP